jgi:hypothetical protein
MKLWQKKSWMKRGKNCVSLHGLCEYIGNPNAVTWDSHIYIHCVLVLVAGGGHTILTTWGNLLFFSQIFLL